MHYYLTALKQFSVFDGRTQRDDYRKFITSYRQIMILEIPIFIVLIFTPVFNIIQVHGLMWAFILVGLFNVLAFGIPYCALTIRRSHDIGKSGHLFLYELLLILFSLLLTIAQDNVHVNLPVNFKNGMTNLSIVAMIIYMIWLHSVLWYEKGDLGSNEYGPSPENKFSTDAADTSKKGLII